MKFESLYLELANSTQMICSLLAGVSQEDATVKPTTETWSILEVVCHLYDEEREDFREHLDFILHRQNKEWHTIHPREWVSERKYNHQNFDEMQGRFFTEREKSLDCLKGLSTANWETTCTSGYGSVPAGEMFAAWIAHDNLHIRQLVELRRARIEQIAQPYSVMYAGDW
jgi:hypothetical protein